MGFFKSLFGKSDSKERRRSDRTELPQLAVFYWDGAAPKAHNIRDISPSGLYLLTEDRWYPGTLVMMTLQNNERLEDGSEQTIAVQARAVRWGEDGVGLAFVLPDAKNSRHGREVMENGADQKALDEFLSRFQSRQLSKDNQ
jgi:hypothetical protein